MTISKVVKYDTNDAKKDLLSLVGDLSKFEVFNNQVLVAVYVRPEKTKGGIFLPDKAKDEDKYQSKVGLILKVGPSAFVDDAQNWFKGVTVQEHDWIIFRPSDGWQVTLNTLQKSISREDVVDCRIVGEASVRMRVTDPDFIY